MALGSRLKAIDQQLATIITAGVDSTVKVTRGHPGKNIEWEAVWTEDIVFEAEPKPLGNNARRQQITVPIVVRVKQEGDDYPALRDRACDIADQVEEALRNPANINLGGQAEYGWVESGALSSFKDDDGNVGAVVLQAMYYARKG